jgi:hypothetical protein
VEIPVRWIRKLRPASLVPAHMSTGAGADDPFSSLRQGLHPSRQAESRPTSGTVTDQHLTMGSKHSSEQSTLTATNTIRPQSPSQLQTPAKHLTTAFPLSISSSPPATHPHRPQNRANPRTCTEEMHAHADPREGESNVVLVPLTPRREPYSVCQVGSAPPQHLPTPTYSCLHTYATPSPPRHQATACTSPCTCPRGYSPSQ